MSARRIQQALILVLIAAGGLLLFADFFGLRGDHKKTKEAAVVQTFTIVRTVRPVSRGSILRAEDLEVRPSRDSTAVGALSQVADARGRIATRDIAAGEPVSAANSALAPAQGTLAFVIPPGLRAVALRVTDDSAVANLIQPGDHVDVLLVSNAIRTQAAGEPAFPDAEARTMLQNIQVLAVGDIVIGGAKSGPNYRNVTLAVTPKQAAMVALSKSVGTQVLSLRAIDDITDSSAGASLTTGDLRLSDTNHIATVTETAPSDAGHAVEVISGSRRSTEVVPLGRGQ